MGAPAGGGGTEGAAGKDGRRHVGRDHEVCLACRARLGSTASLHRHEKDPGKTKAEKSTRRETAGAGRPGASKPSPGMKKGCLYRKPKFILLRESVEQFQERGRHSHCGCCVQTQQRSLSRLSSRARLLQALGKKDKGVPCSLRPGVS